MLSTFLRRIKKTGKKKSPTAVAAGDPAGRTETGIAADTEPSEPGMGSAGDRLSALLKIIMDNAECLRIMYGDSLPVKNIKTATNQAMDAAARLKKLTPSKDE